jgi:lipoate-protein ligase A
MILFSNSLDTYFNLALEEYVLENGPYPSLLLWRSRCAVVVGKNQNPWRECRLSRLAERGGVLARRVSGGGAVYHDPGNLNCALIVDRGSYDPNALYALITSALEPLGIHTETVAKRHALHTHGHKFSGSAFCLRPCGAMHHATLLVDADLGFLQSVLATDDRVSGRGITSVPAEVANLSAYASDLDCGSVAEALSGSFSLRYERGSQPMSLADLPAGSLDVLREKYASSAWRFDSTPPFQWTCFLQTANSQPQPLTLQVREGRIDRVEYAPSGSSKSWTEALLNVSFETLAIDSVLRGFNETGAAAFRRVLARNPL